MKKDENQKGSLTLETAIVLPIFIFIMLMIFGMFSVVSAQNKISHALIQSSRSMSLDPYYMTKVSSAGEAETQFWGKLSDMVMDLVSLNDDKHFVVHNDWYANAGGSPVVAKNRFVGYLAGGDEDEANEILTQLGVIGGLDGITFKTAVVDEDLTVTISYKLQYVLDAFDMGQIPVKQSITVKLWK